MSDGGIYSSDDLIAAISQALQCSPIKLGIPKFVMPLFGALAEKDAGVQYYQSRQDAGDTPPLLDVRCDKGKGETLVFLQK